MNIRVSETDHHPLGRTGTILAASPSRAEAGGYCHPPSDPRDLFGEPVQRVLVELHHLIRLDYHKKVRSEGPLSDSFIPFRASVWVHVFGRLPNMFVRSVTGEGAQSGCNLPWTASAIIRVRHSPPLAASTLRSVCLNPGAHISGPR